MESHNGGKPGGTCAIQYLLENVDLSRVGAIKIEFFIYHKDFEKREGCLVVARDKHESHMSQ